MPERVSPGVSRVPEVGDGNDWLEALDGTRLFHRWWNAVPPRRGVLLIVHGLKDHSARYDHLARPAAALGLEVHAADLRGHGRSDGVRAHVRRFDDYLSDLSVLRSHVRKAAPHGPLFLLGHSVGGAIATGWTLEAGTPPDGLVLSAAALAPPPEVRAGTKRAARLLSVLAPRARIFETKDEYFSRDPETRRADAADPLIFHGKGTARLGAELLRRMDRSRAAFGSLRAPLLALHGTGDHLTDPAGSRELVDRAASSEKRLVVYSDLYHDLPHEPEREQVVRDVTGWLAARIPVPA